MAARSGGHCVRGGGYRSRGHVTPGECYGVDDQKSRDGAIRSHTFRDRRDRVQRDYHRSASWNRHDKETDSIKLTDIQMLTEAKYLSFPISSLPGAIDEVISTSERTKEDEVVVIAERHVAGDSKELFHPELPMTKSPSLPHGAKSLSHWTKSLQDIGQTVNSIKSQLDDTRYRDMIFEILRQCNVFFDLRHRISREYNGQIVTNAWLKFVELMHRHHLFPSASSKEPVRVFFNAALPGTWTAAMHHYMVMMHPTVDYKWCASSFYPLDSTKKALGDTYGMYELHRENWLMDDPHVSNKTDTITKGVLPGALPATPLPTSFVNNGDVTNVDTILDLASRARHKLGGLATLYATDVGTDVAEDYNREEELTSHLNFGQIVLGLLTLSPGSSIISKQFMFVTPFSATLLALLSGMFARVHIDKPSASRPGNSEVFIICVGFKGISLATQEWLIAKLRLCQPDKKPTQLIWNLLQDDIHHATIESILVASQKIHGVHQSSCLMEAIRIAHGKRGRYVLRDLKRLLREKTRACQDDWLAANPVPVLPREKMLRLFPHTDR